MGRSFFVGKSLAQKAFGFAQGKLRASQGNSDWYESVWLTGGRESGMNGSWVHLVNGCFDGSGIFDARARSAPGGNLVCNSGVGRPLYFAICSAEDYGSARKGLAVGWLRGGGVPFGDSAFFSSSTPHLRAGLVNGVAEATHVAQRTFEKRIGERYIQSGVQLGWSLAALRWTAEGGCPHI